MGEIWLAYHVALGVNVAVKLMSPALIPDATARARFRREARAAARLRSPHVVAVQDFGEDGGAPYLVMEALEGETLEKHTGKRPLDPLEAAELVDQAARGLGSAHAHGVVHRDVKPSNLFLANVDGQSVLKLIDFGIARALNDEDEGKVTRSGAILGSPTFMSPEQASGDPATHASDLWSLAAVTYWMVTGREPFAGRMMSETLHRIRTVQFTKPTEVNPRLPCAIDGFFAKAFRVDPGERYESAEQLAAAFRAVVVGDESFSTLLLDGTLSKSHHARAPRRHWYRGPLALVLMGSSVTAGAVVLSRLPGVPHRAESPPPAARTAVPALKYDGKPMAMRIAFPAARRELGIHIGRGRRFGPARGAP